MVTFDRVGQAGAIDWEAKPLNKLEDTWHIGYFFGTKEGTAEAFIDSGGGSVVAARTIKRMSADPRVSPKTLEAIVGVPWCMSPGFSVRNAIVHVDVPREPVGAGGKPEDLSDPAPDAHAARSRNTYIRRREIEMCSYTAGCPACENLKAVGQSFVGHNSVCRARAEARIKETEEGRDKLAETKRRKVTGAEARDILHGRGPAKPGALAPQPASSTSYMIVGDPEGTGPKRGSVKRQAVAVREGGRDVASQGTSEQHPGARPSDAAANADSPAGPQQVGQKRKNAEVAGTEETTEDESKGHAIPAISALSLDGNRRGASCIAAAAQQTVDGRVLASLGYDVHVSEVYNPERFKPEAERLGFRFGDAFDLRLRRPDSDEHWDFNLEAHREHARSILAKRRPLILIGSPLCRVHS